MNILFVLYNDFACNSASHVHALANELAKLGHDCVVAVPANKESRSNLGAARYREVDFGEALTEEFAFTDGRGPDLLHAWTPREVVRTFCETMQKRHACHLFVHMEDNEWHLLACSLAIPWNRLVLYDDEDLDRMMQPHLSHPRKGLAFMAAADGITVIIDRLRELVPQNVPTLELWPAADETLFRPLPKTEHAREILRIPRNSAVIVYTGNVHAANAHEMRSLYLAVAILNREGQPTTLVRAGRNFHPFLGPREEWALQYSIELGAVPHKEIPSLLAMADILVQPGRADRFNDYRFPSKLPEFLSAGRPVVIPNTNIASRMTHREHAFILPNASALAIVDAAREILGDAKLRDRLSRGSIEFSKAHLSWRRSAGKLSLFYRERPKPLAVDPTRAIDLPVRLEVMRAVGV